MTGAERQHLRTLIDARRRELTPTNGCRGCGTDLDTRTAGCKTCTNRWLRRKWRVDNDYRAKERVYDRHRRPPGARSKATA